MLNFPNFGVVHRPISLGFPHYCFVDILVEVLIFIEAVFAAISSFTS